MPRIRRPNCVSLSWPSRTLRIRPSTRSAASGRVRETQSTNTVSTARGNRSICHDAERAPASAAASRMAGTSLSVRPGMIGASITRTGMPASESVAIVRSRASGELVRGSSFRARPASRVVRLSETLTAP